METGVLLIVCGPSGVGKTTLGRRLRQEHGELVLSVSDTTRDARVGEVDGRDYSFLTREAFGVRRTEGAYAEWAEVHGNLYGTPRAEISRNFERGQDVFFDIDFQGARQLIEGYPGQTVPVLIVPPSMSVLEARLRGRETDAPDVIERRLAAARAELAQYELFEYVVVNDDLERAYRDLEHIYLASRRSTRLHLGLMREMVGAEALETEGR